MLHVGISDSFLGFCFVLFSRLELFYKGWICISDKEKMML